MDIFMQLQGKLPFWVAFDIFDDEGGDIGGPAPFWLEEKPALGVYPGCPLFGPLEVRFIVYDDLQFVGKGEYIREGGLEFLG
jgi:hypothetical protein